MGMLVSPGIKVLRARLHAVLPLIDQRSRTIQPCLLLCWVYRVPWINALWHIDGHHKLIRWGIVIHGGIDGYSRMVTFLQASDNNRANTVAGAFPRATTQYGWPSRVRADCGKENRGVQLLMEEARGEYR
jgi:hypothetical protein